jgi:glycosyltransferase involved in cell wall biosynthesis
MLSIPGILPLLTETNHQKPSAPALSVIAPCYNEEGGITIFVARMAAAARSVVGEDFELLLVNDGSKDRTWPTIQALALADPRIAAINLARNHGHQLAVTAGLTLARGEHILIIDADLQDPPELLAEMMAKMAEGYDVVYGKRRSRAEESQFKLQTASLFYRLLNVVAEVEIPRDTGDFRLMSRRTVERLNAMPERDRFIRGMVAWLGGRQAELLYDRDPRYAGATNYTLSRMVRLAVDGVTGFSTLPLRLASLLAGVGVILAIGIIIYTLFSFMFGTVAVGWTSQALLTVFFATAQLSCLGVMGSYLGRTYMQVKGRPLFLIDEIVTAPVGEGLP